MNQIPLVPNGSWPVYGEVEQFLLDTDKTVADLSYEQIGQLARLAADLRSDAGHLEVLAKDVEELIDYGVDALRNRELNGNAAAPAAKQHHGRCRGSVMSVTAKTSFRETSLALCVLEERLYLHSNEAIDIHESLQQAIDVDFDILEPSEDPDRSEKFFDAVRAITAVEPTGSLGERLAKLRDDGELNGLTFTPDQTATLASIHAKLKTTITALGKVEDDFAAVLDYCGDEDRKDGGR